MCGGMSPLLWTTDRKCPLGVVLLSSRWPTPPLSLLAPRRTSSSEEEEEEGEGGILFLVAMMKVSSRRPGARTARSLHSLWTPMMMTMLFLTEDDDDDDDDDAHPSSETSRLWGGAGEEEDNTNTNTNTNRGAEGIARSRAGFSATGSPRTPHPKRP